MHGVPGSDAWGAPKRQPGTSRKRGGSTHGTPGAGAWDAPKCQPGAPSSQSFDADAFSLLDFNHPFKHLLTKEAGGAPCTGSLALTLGAHPSVNQEPQGRWSGSTHGTPGSGTWDAPKRQPGAPSSQSFSKYSPTKSQCLYVIYGQGMVSDRLEYSIARMQIVSRSSFLFCLNF